MPQIPNDNELDCEKKFFVGEDCGDSNWGPKLKSVSYDLTLAPQPQKKPATEIRANYTNGCLYFEITDDKGDGLYIITDDFKEKAKVLDELIRFCTDTVELMIKENKHAGKS